MSKVVPIVLAVTTMNQNATQAIKYFSQFAHKHCHVYISHQITDKDSNALDINTPYVWYNVLYSTWLSKNRNHILKQLQNGIYVVCDDDIKLEKDFEKIIRSAYAKHNTACVTFQTHTGACLRKSYSTKPYKHTIFSILKVSSIEITFDIAKIKAKNVKFDESFGLGTDQASGEENIFLKDCLDWWLLAQYIPKVINIHEEESSGKHINRAVKNQVCKRMYGNIRWTWVFLLLRIYKFMK